MTRRLFVSNQRLNAVVVGILPGPGFRKSNPAERIQSDINLWKKDTKV